MKFNYFLVARWLLYDRTEDLEVSEGFWVTHEHFTNIPEALSNKSQLQGFGWRPPPNQVAHLMVDTAANLISSNLPPAESAHWEMLMNLKNKMTEFRKVRCGLRYRCQPLNFCRSADWLDGRNKRTKCTRSRSEPMSYRVRCLLVCDYPKGRWIKWQRTKVAAEVCDSRMWLLAFLCVPWAGRMLHTLKHLKRSRSECTAPWPKVNKAFHWLNQTKLRKWANESTLWFRLAPYRIADLQCRAGIHGSVHKYSQRLKTFRPMDHCSARNDVPVSKNVINCIELRQSGALVWIFKRRTFAIFVIIGAFQNSFQQLNVSNGRAIFKVVAFRLFLATSWYSPKGHVLCSD